MTTPPLRKTAARRHARNARLGSRPTRPVVQREQLGRFTRDSSVFVSWLRNGYLNSEWGVTLREGLRQSRFGDLLDELFRAAEGE
jgi:hypothetical protein